MAYLIGAYVGGLLITFLLTRLARRILWRRVGPEKASIGAFIVVALLALVLGSLIMGPAEGLSGFLLVYLPCLLFWLGLDFYRLRAPGPTTPRQ